MNDDRTVSNPGKMVLPANKLELRRLLLEQFYEDSVNRHGDNGQIRILSRLLSQERPLRAHKQPLEMSMRKGL